MRLVLIIALFVGVLLGKSSENFILLKDTPKDATIIKTSPFLWKATRGDTTIYLFGTIHIPHPTLTISPKLKAVMNECDVIKTEIALDKSVKLKATLASIRDDGKTLEEILPKETFKRLDAQLMIINPMLSAKAFNKFKIWAVSSSLSLLEYQLKYRNYKALDKQIYKWARDNNKSAGGIETIEEQLGMFDSFNQQEQIAMLEASLDSLEKKPKQIEKLLNSYLKADGENILKQFKESMQSARVSEDLKKRYLEKILYSRNVRMAKRINELISKNPKKKYLFAFGTMHFLGQKSVLFYLKKSGFKVERSK